jgi:hypothetical protein
MPNIDSTMGCCRRGKEFIRIVCDKGTTGAPVAPWTMRHSTKVSRDWARPHRNVATEKLKIPKVITRLAPKRATSHPVIGVTTAVARILKVMTQAISS